MAFWASLTYLPGDGVGMTSVAGRGSSVSSLALGRELPAVSLGFRRSTGRGSVHGWPAHQHCLPQAREVCLIWGRRARKHTSHRFWRHPASCFHHDHRCRNGLHLLAPLSCLFIVQNIVGKEDCYLGGPQRRGEAWVANTETIRDPTMQFSLKGVEFISWAVKVLKGFTGRKGT